MSTTDNPASSITAAAADVVCDSGRTVVGVCPSAVLAGKAESEGLEMAIGSYPGSNLKVHPALFALILSAFLKRQPAAVAAGSCTTGTAIARSCSPPESS